MPSDSLQPRIHLANLAFCDKPLLYLIRCLSCVVHCLLGLLSNENHVLDLLTLCSNTIIDDEVMRTETVHHNSLTLTTHPRLNLLPALIILAEATSTALFNPTVNNATMISHALSSSAYVVALIGRDLTTKFIIIHAQLGDDLVHGNEHI